MNVRKIVCLSLLLLWVAASSGCALAYYGATSASQSANMKRVTVEYGVTTPEEVVAALGTPDEENQLGIYPYSYYITYKTLYSWSGLEVTWCRDGRCKTYDYSHKGIGGSGTVRFYFTDGKATFERGYVPEYELKK